MRPQHEKEEIKTVKVIYANEEQKAWDMFAAAALTGLLTCNEEIPPFQSREEILDYYARSSTQYADAMMEQRKARMK